MAVTAILMLTVIMTMVMAITTVITTMTTMSTGMDTRTTTVTIMHTRMTTAMMNNKVDMNTTSMNTMTTTMDSPMDMRTTTSTEPAALAPAGLLHLLWLASPALPVGGFSYSEGLEAAIDAGLVSSETQAAGWLAEQLHLTLARSDLPIIAQTLRAWQCGDTARVRALNTWLLQTRESAELRLQTEQMGRSLREWLRHLPGADSAVLDFAATLEPGYPVMYALCASGPAGAQSVPVDEHKVRNVLLAYAFGWAENMMQAALKAVPLGQTSGQRILARLATEIPTAVEHALQLPDEERQAYSPMLAILSSRHETQYSRLFRS
jgi:urease accessory protein